MNYADISKETIGYLYKSYNSLEKVTFDRKLLVLAELRVSQLNCCAYCCALHAEEARCLGIPDNVLDRLPGWRYSSSFNTLEKQVLEWAEALTLMVESIDDIKQSLQAHFTDKELVDLTAGISLMNTFNRLAIALGSNH